MIWVGALSWLIVFRDIAVTHRRVFVALASVLIPTAIMSILFAKRRTPWLALSLNLLMVGLVLMAIRLVCEEFLKIEHFAMDWLAWGESIFVWLSMLTGIFTSVRKLREKGSSETNA